MKILDTVGIDMSKLTFDVRIHSSRAYVKLKNSKEDFKELIKWAYKNSTFSKENILFIFEHTGLYSHQLAVYLTEQKVPFALVPGLEIKRSLGIARGKDDKVDATKIALYGYRLRDEIKTYQLPTKQILSIKRLLSLRERLVKQRAGFKTSFKEQKRFLILNKNKTLFAIQQKMVTTQFQI
jgi:transposase